MPEYMWWILGYFLVGVLFILGTSIVNGFQRSGNRLENSDRLLIILLWPIVAFLIPLLIGVVFEYLEDKLWLFGSWLKTKYDNYLDSRSDY